MLICTTQEAQKEKKFFLNLCDKNTPWLYMRTDTVTDCEKYNYEKNI